jgi:hypothetical protein
VIAASLHYGTKAVSPFPCPTSADIAAETLQACARIETRIGREGNGALARLRPWLEQEPGRRSLPAATLARLQHPLSPYIEAMNRNTPRHGASASEAAIARRLAPGALARPRGLEALLRQTIRLVDVPNKGLRTINVATRPDLAGNRVRYPPPMAVSPALEALGRFAEGCWRETPLFAATVCLAGVAAIHPFVDGNGRTSRIVFNYVLRDALAAADFYLPIFEIAGLSRGGFIIRLRDAHYNGRWEPLLAYMCDSIAFALG